MLLFKMISGFLARLVSWQGLWRRGPRETPLNHGKPANLGTLAVEVDQPRQPLTFATIQSAFAGIEERGMQPEKVFMCAEDYLDLARASWQQVPQGPPATDNKPRLWGTEVVVSNGAIPPGVLRVQTDRGLEFTFGPNQRSQHGDLVVANGDATYTTGQFNGFFGEPTWFIPPAAPFAGTVR